jgi:hypothetical protein
MMCLVRMGLFMATEVQKIGEFFRFRSATRKDFLICDQLDVLYGFGRQRDDERTLELFIMNGHFSEREHQMAGQAHEFRIVYQPQKVC